MTSDGSTIEDDETLLHIANLNSIFYLKPCDNVMPHHNNATSNDLAIVRVQFFITIFSTIDNRTTEELALANDDVVPVIEPVVHPSVLEEDTQNEYYPI